MIECNQTLSSSGLVDYSSSEDEGSRNEAQSSEKVTSPIATPMTAPLVVDSAIVQPHSSVAKKEDNTTQQSLSKRQLLSHDSEFTNKVSRMESSLKEPGEQFSLQNKKSLKSFAMLVEAYSLNEVRILSNLIFRDIFC